ncbi:hypothetical protein GOICGAJE_02522 [Bacillus sp. MB95]|nr:hypothetical protein [Bacillus sp. MB95]
MIFVTVGTHEQQFDRLIQFVDGLKEKECIKDEIFYQTGYSNYIPKNGKSKSLIGYEEMVEYVKKSRVVITHGGPGSIMLPLSYGKIPIVVPRQKEFGEHVDNHQVLFSKRISAEGKVIPIYNITDLEEALNFYEKKIEDMNHVTISNLDNFTTKLDELVLNLF